MQTSAPYLSRFPMLQEKLQFTTIIVVLFTTFIQGSTIGNLVKFFQISLKDEDTDNIEQDMNRNEIDDLTFAEKIHHLAYYQMIRGVNSILHADVQVDWLARMDPILDMFDDWLLRDEDDLEESTSMYLKSLAGQHRLGSNDDLLIEEDEEYDEEFADNPEFLELKESILSDLCDSSNWNGVIRVEKPSMASVHGSSNSEISVNPSPRSNDQADNRKSKNRQVHHLKHKRIAGSINYHFDHEHFDLKQEIVNMFSRISRTSDQQRLTTGSVVDHWKSRSSNKSSKVDPNNDPTKKKTGISKIAFAKRLASKNKTNASRNSRSVSRAWVVLR